MGSEDRIAHIILDEFRIHRSETKKVHEDILRRLSSLEQTKAREEGSRAVKDKHFGIVGGLVAFVVTVVVNVAVKLWP